MIETVCGAVGVAVGIVVRHFLGKLWKNENDLVMEETKYICNRLDCILTEFKTHLAKGNVPK